MVRGFENRLIYPLKFSFYYYPFIFLVLAGLSDSVYLFISHYKNYTDISYVSFCAISRSINCDTVAQSKYSILMGLPVSLWGLAGYGFLLLLAIIAGNKGAEKRQIWPFIFFVSLLFSVFSLFLAFVSSYYIRSYCIMCILSYAICFGCLFYSWIIRNRFGKTDLIKGLVSDALFLKKNKFFWSGVFCILLFISLSFFYLPKYWLLEPNHNTNKKIETGLTQEGYPWIGATTPKLTITLFSDYQCFECRKTHFFLRRLIEANSDKLRLVCRNYPLDNEFNSIVTPLPFHIGSGKLSLIATYSAFIGKFWEVSDSLFRISNHNSRKEAFSVDELAKITGMNKNDILIALNHPEIRQRLSIDILEGMKLKITSTPALVINDKVYIGNIPEDIIKKAIDE